MKIISYPIAYLGLTNTVSALEIKNTPFEKTQFYIEGRMDGTKDIRDVLATLVDNGWLYADNKEENNRRVAVLNLLSKYSMTTVALEHVKREYPYLHHDDISIDFKFNSNSGLEVNYLVPYSDGHQPLFTLGSQLFLGKNFELDEEKSRVFFEFKEQCPSDLKGGVDRRTIKDMILDWLKNLFSNSHNFMPVESKHIFGTVGTVDTVDTVDISPLPFSALTNDELKYDALKMDVKFDHPENSYWEDDLAEQHIGIDVGNIHRAGYMEGYKKGEAAGYNDGVDIGLTLRKAEIFQ